MISLDFTIFIQWLNFGILVLILYFILYKPLIRFIDKRNAKLLNDLEAARRTGRQNEELNQQYHERFAQLKQQSKEYMDRTKKQAVVESENVIKEAHVEADRIIQNARKEAVFGAEKAKQELKQDVAGLVINCASQILEREVKESDYKRLINSFLEGETKDE
jgi:F-type H+-transporting ATPase subunit b